MRLHMKFVACSGLLLFTFAASAQAPEPMPLAHGNEPGEPHHHLKIENTWKYVSLAFKGSEPLYKY